MLHPSTIRRRVATAAPTRAVLVAMAAVLVASAFVIMAFVARPAPGGAAGASSAPGQTALDHMISGGHPDFVGVAEPRSPAGVVHLVVSPTVGPPLAIALVVVITAALLGGSGRHLSRWRRWRARLEGAPPLVA